MDQSEATVADLVFVIENLHNRINAMNEQNNRNLPTVAQAPMKKKLPDPERYDGEDRSHFPAFEINLKAKVHGDAEILGNAKDRVLYAYSRLSGKAAALMQPWIEANGGAPSFNFSNFLDQLRMTFRDPESTRRAATKLANMQQGTASLTEYLADFDRTMLEAKAHLWTEDSKISYLRKGLRPELLDHLQFIDEPDEYIDFCAKLKWIEQKRESTAALKLSQGLVVAPQSKISGNRSNKVGGAKPTSSPDTMDWEPTLSKLRQRRAKGVSSGEIKKRREENRCIRCGSSEHFLKNCIF